MQNFINAPHRGETPGVPTGAPNAALLIDFDNVTMGIRSDLTRQLKELLNSDIIRGKVAVQRAYADWRRYAQYIVPLSEASVDLIFAPAYGSSKKNATDIRLAIDALELVFTRPEIGTYILLSGDSDFSSLVLKLKEYGKYVIGVGLRESASDLLVQNCDEYYSYSSLTGLTKAGEEEMVGAIDPWELVERSVTQMAQDNDVMRSDRLKQVMLDLDPSFDEGEIGYSKFNKFLTEAASRSKLALKKLGNGQYEVQPLAKGASAPAREAREEKPSRGRGRREESRGRKRPEPPKEIAAAPSPRKEREPKAQKPRPQPQPRERSGEDLREGYELLKRAIRELVENPGDPARDSDIKRKMLELESGWDESELGFTKFSRFLRQAHDAEVVDLQRTSQGYYEARLPSGVGPSGPRKEHRRTERAEAEAPREERKREEPKPEEPKRPAAKREEPKREAPKPKAEAPKPEEREREQPEPTPKAQEEKKAPEPEAAEPAGQPQPQGRGPSYGRRGRKGRPEGPPPLLPGQAVGSSSGAGGGAEKAEAKPATSQEPESQPAPSAPARQESQPRAEQPREAEKAAEKPAEAPGAPAFDPEEIGLPTDAAAVIRYLSNSYQGVGQKTAEALIEEFGEAGVFNGLNSQPERVRRVLGSGRRTEILLEAWERDYRRRTTAGAGDKQPAG